MLKSDAQAPISYEKFLDYCSNDVSPAKFLLLKDLTVDSIEGPLIKEWSDYYSRFKEELTGKRIKRLGDNTYSSNVSGNSFSGIISTAMAESNPLTAEKMLIEYHFEVIDSLVGYHVFDDYALFGYALKLKILERKNIFDFKNGKNEFKRLINCLEEQIERIH